MVYADTEWVVNHLDPPEAKSGEAFADKIKEQGPQVEAVNWVWEKVTGENLVEAVISPMTGDWAKIAADGEAWNNAAKGIEQISINLSDNVAKLDPHWEGEAAAAFEQHVDFLWAAALYAEAGVARLIAKGFDFVADQSERLCKEALDLLTKLINKLLWAAGAAVVPIAGWAAAAKLVWDAYGIYKSIMALINAVEAVVRAAETLIKSATDIKNALESLPDVRSLSDAIELGRELKGSAGEVKTSTKEVTDSTTEAKETLDEHAPR